MVNEHGGRACKEGARGGSASRTHKEDAQGECASRACKESAQGGYARRACKEAAQRGCARRARRESVQVSTGQTHSSFAARCACAWWKLTSLKLKDLSHILVRNNRNSAVEVEVKVRADTLEAQLDFHRLMRFLPQ